MRFALSILGLILSLMTSASAFATTKEELLAFVQEAAAHVKQVGNEKAFADFNDPKGNWRRGELYVFVYEYGKDDVSCTCRAHGLNPSLVGRAVCDLKDKHGNFPHIELMKAAKSGKHYAEYWWPHPVTRVVTKKLGYAQDLDGKYFIGSGIYLDEK